MIEKETLVLIPARGGSKGVPKKNIKLLVGKPLIQYTLDFASDYFDHIDICVSTDSQEIKAVVEKLGYDVPFIRPDHLATDQAGSREVILHAINYYIERGIKYKNVLLLQPTSPIRNKTTFEKIMNLAGSTSDYDMIVSVKEAKSNPYFNLFEENADGYLIKSKTGSYTRRQDCPEVYEYSGVFYYISSESIIHRNIGDFEKVIKVIDNELVYNIDIDTEFDWKVAELIMSEYQYILI
jgi:CMP-N,N'-diacetyllegionaminic acid synthase